MYNHFKTNMIEEANDTETNQGDEQRICVDCFYVGKQVKDKKSVIYNLFSKRVSEEVKTKFVIAAHKAGVTYREKIQSQDGREGYRIRQVTDPIDVAVAFSQITKGDLLTNLVMYQNKLYDVLYQEFGQSWDLPLETKVMNDLGYCYSETNHERDQAGIKKGDVRKMITTKYREIRKYILHKIEKTHGRGVLSISRSRLNGTEKDGKLIRGGRNQRKFYVNTTSRKVSIYICMFVM